MGLGVIKLVISREKEEKLIKQINGRRGIQTHYLEVHAKEKKNKEKKTREEGFQPTTSMLKEGAK